MKEIKMLNVSDVKQDLDIKIEYLTKDETWHISAGTLADLLHEGGIMEINPTFRQEERRYFIVQTEVGAHMLYRTKE